MRAAVCPRYGPPEVIEIREVPTPEPRAGEIRVRVVATTVSAGDWRVRSGEVPRGFGFLMRLALGFGGPRQSILGTELAGVVDAVGAGVRRFQVGDEVFGFGGVKGGCHAEARCFPEDGLVAPKPANLSFEEAAALCFGGTTALDYLRRGRLVEGERLLVNGASGSVGTAAVQIGKHLGAHVTGVCSAANADLVRGLGADRVLDHGREDFAEGAERYDVILDAVGNLTYRRCRGVLADGGRLLLAAAELGELIRGLFVGLTTRHRVVVGPAAERVEGLHELARLATDGVYRPVIDRRYPFESIVEAHRYVDTRRKRGNVVVRLAPLGAPALAMSAEVQP